LYFISVNSDFKKLKKLFQVNLPLQHMDVIVSFQRPLDKLEYKVNFYLSKSKFTLSYFIEKNFVCFLLAVLDFNRYCVSNLNTLFLNKILNYEIYTFLKKWTEELTLIFSSTLPYPITSLIFLVAVLKWLFLNFLEVTNADPDTIINRFLNFK